MKDEWSLFKVTSTKSLWHYLIVQEDQVMLKMTSEQARKIYNLLKEEFERDPNAPVFDRT